MRANASLKTIALVAVNRAEGYKLRYNRAMKEWTKSGGRFASPEYKKVQEAQALLNAVSDIADGLKRHFLN